MGRLIPDNSRTWTHSFYAGYAGGDVVHVVIGALKDGLNLLWSMDIRKAVCEMVCLEFIESLDKDKCKFHIYMQGISLTFLEFWNVIGMFIFNIFPVKSMLQHIIPR